ncbi:MAG: F0F1 ATP synthase subunit epsilon [Bacteroidales bacterium]|nr:F0F1 ATP synthase subunit epsilon [Bacteroidales bacterium]
MSNLKLEIYTPNGVLFDGEVTSVTLPGTKGLFTVLKNHGAIISSLTKGVIKYVINEEIATIEVIGGFAEVKRNVVTVCLETIIK